MERPSAPFYAAWTGLARNMCLIPPNACDADQDGALNFPEAERPLCRPGTGGSCDVSVGRLVSGTESLALIGFKLHRFSPAVQLSELVYVCLRL
jgi:hypothetical protein